MSENNKEINQEVDNLDWYDEELLDYVREETTDNEEITSLLDQDILYLYELWDEYVETLEGEEEEVEIDSNDLYSFVEKQAQEDEEDIDISLDNLVLLIQLQQEFDESLGEDDDEDE